MVSDKKWKALKADLKAATRKTAPSTFDERTARLKEIQRRWINYFRMASMQTKLKETDSWLRNRLRYCFWEDWKKWATISELLDQARFVDRPLLMSAYLMSHHIVN